MQELGSSAFQDTVNTENNTENLWNLNLMQAVLYST